MVSAAKSGSTLGYTYDSWGRRITRSLNGSKVWYYYDGDNVVMERDAGKNVLARYDYGPGTDEVLCLYKGSSTYYYHADGQGSTGDIMPVKDVFQYTDR